MLGPSRSRISTSRTVRRGYGILAAMDRPGDAALEPPSHWPAACRERLGAAVSIEPDPEGRLGDTIVGRFHGVGAGRLLLLAHLDTVFPAGTAAERPFRLEGGR